MKWRKWNNILHRDIGYVIVALTWIYAVSGIALNHISQWNPNYRTVKEISRISPIQGATREEIVSEALAKLNLTEKPKNAFRPDPETLQLFFEKKTYSIDLPTGNVLAETTRPRPVLYEMNQLHLNSPKKLWTWLADLYALALIVVATTGMFVLKGKGGITRRGAWLTLIGLLIPVLFWVYFSLKEVK